MLSKIKIRTQKGVSPLIATILLVAVSLSLAGILYSWASQNAGDTVSDVSETQQKWSKCSSINLLIEPGCRYDTSTGISLILYDSSTIDIDENLVIEVFDTNNVIKHATFAPNFSGSAMTVNSSILDDADALDGLGQIQRVRVYVGSCSDKAATTTSCD
jgi:flagellin-like protein